MPCGNTPVRTPLIGKRARVTGSPLQGIAGLEGTIEDETKHTLTINGKRLPKDQLTFEVDGKVLEGTRACRTVAERIKVHHP